MTGFQHFFRLLSPMARFFIPSTPQAGIPTFPIPTSLASFERQILIMPIYANLTLGLDRKICPMILKPFDCDFQVCCENLSRIRLGWQLHYAPILHLCLLFLSCLRFAFPSCFVCPFFPFYRNVCLCSSASVFSFRNFPSRFVSFCPSSDSLRLPSVSLSFSLKFLFFIPPSSHQSSSSQSLILPLNYFLDRPHPRFVPKTINTHTRTS